MYDVDLRQTERRAMSPDSRQSVRRALLNSARRVSVERRGEIEKWYPVRARGTEYVPAYIPYIGSDYFSPEADGQRILAYALSQNLREDDAHTCTWAHDWNEGDGQLALDRQNAAFAADGIAMMHPFDTGHIPILASLLRSLVSDQGPIPDRSIYPEIAATNLSKFSFRSEADRAVDSTAALRCCWDWLSEHEVRLLRPDYVICCDRRVYRIVSAGIARYCPAAESRPIVLRVSFPGLLVINSHYRRPLRPEHLSFEQMAGLMAARDLDRSVDHGLTVRAVLERDAYYFAEMLRRMGEQVQQQRNGRDT